MSELCRVMGIEKTNITAFHPQGNSRCGRVNWTILGMLAKYLPGNHNEWDRHLPLLMLSYRADSQIARLQPLLHDVRTGAESAH